MWCGSRARVFVYAHPCDMRKSFAGLCGIVRAFMQGDPLSGHYFFFMNRSKNYIKILWWDGTGYCITAKRLAQGCFIKPKSKELLLQELLSQIEYSKKSETHPKTFRFLPE